MESFKFIDNKQYQMFLSALDEIECTTESIKQDKDFMQILNNGHVPSDTTKEKILPRIEGFLHWFCDNEEYETCQSIINAWPQLKINS